YIVFDPCAWLEGDTYYALIGNTIPGQSGDGTALFKSSNLAEWEFVRSFYQSQREWTDAKEDCAVPDFYPLGDKHMLLFCSHWQGTQYYLGRFENERYYVESYGRMSWAGGMLGGPRSLLDDQGRRIFFDWVREIRGIEEERAAGWSGIMTVPRILSLATDGSLQIEPVPELECLRMNPKAHKNITLNADEVDLEDIQGSCIELAAEIDPGDATEVGVQVLCSPDQSEQTGVVYVPEEGTLKVDISRSTLNEAIKYPHYRDAGGTARLPAAERYVDAQRAPFVLKENEILQLRIYVDKSVVEVFANGRQCITQRVYPTRSDSTGVRLLSRGGQAHFRSIQAWEMAPAF
ncbi:MAG: GH32 C-terminal domain-containing protein, partial [Candidatus Poribacteria bacterium]|nr:GH32 C-terminal domain-containing protein [Candidatus Poribacteria bacterium]